MWLQAAKKPMFPLTWPSDSHVMHLHGEIGVSKAANMRFRIEPT
jgi:hypothetical protein